MRDSSGSPITVEIDKRRSERQCRLQVQIGGHKSIAKFRYEVEVREQVPTAGMEWRCEIAVGHQ